MGSRSSRALPVRDSISKLGGLFEQPLVAQRLELRFETVDRLGNGAEFLDLSLVGVAEDFCKLEHGSYNRWVRAPGDSRPVSAPRKGRGAPLFPIIRTRRRRWTPHRRGDADGYLNSAPTDSPRWIREIASPNNGATDSIVTLPFRFSGGTGAVSVSHDLGDGGLRGCAQARGPKGCRGWRRSRSLSSRPFRGSWRPRAGTLQCRSRRRR